MFATRFAPDATRSAEEHVFAAWANYLLRIRWGKVWHAADVPDVQPLDALILEVDSLLSA
jgi:hypothetical protein